MAQPYYIRKFNANFDKEKKRVYYAPQLVYAGTLTTRQMARQISEESALTAAEVMGVLERVSHYIKSNTALGYKIKLDGIGTFSNEISECETVENPEEASVKQIKSMRPRFTPERQMVGGRCHYTLMPERLQYRRVKQGLLSGPADVAEVEDEIDSKKFTGQ